MKIILEKMTGEIDCLLVGLIDGYATDEKHSEALGTPRELYIFYREIATLLYYTDCCLSVYGVVTL